MVAEGGKSDALFDLIGLGFSSSKKKKLIRLIAPKVSIVANGKEVTVPDTSVRSTNVNGIVGYDLYETTYKILSGSTDVPIITPSADNPDVKVFVTQAESIRGTATIEFGYKGVVKTYKVGIESE